MDYPPAAHGSTMAASTLARLAMSNPANRHAALLGLRREWAAIGACAGRLHGAASALFARAAAWRDWPLVYAVGTHALVAAELGPREIPHLVEACRQLGKGDEALVALARMSGLPEHDKHALQADLLAWINWRQRFPACYGTGELVLEPLAHHHQPDFAWQYADPAIAALCCLPRFADALAWHHWLADAWHDGARMPYAILHREWGFIGCASLTVHGGIGFFYYWLGHDFQGRGYGPHAGDLLLATGERACGLRCCYAKVFDHNIRSRRGLEKMGFADLGIRGAAEHSDQLFYRRGQAQARRRIVSELDWLLDRMDAQVRPVAPSPATPRTRALAVN